MPDLILRKTEVQCYGKLRFWSEETPKYTIKVAQGFLGKPNADKRSRKAHESYLQGFRGPCRPSHRATVRRPRCCLQSREAELYAK